MSSDNLKKAIQLIKAGKKAEAQQLLEPLIETDPHNLTAWFWYIEALPTVQQRVKALELCLQHNPNSEQVKHALRTLRAQQSAIVPASRPQASVAKPIITHNRQPSRIVKRPARKKTSSWLFIVGGVLLVCLVMIIIGVGIWVAQSDGQFFAASGNPTAIANQV